MMHLMLLSERGEDSNDVLQANEGHGWPEQVIANSRSLRQSLQEKHSKAKALAARLSRLTADLRATAETLADTAANLCAARSAKPLACPEMLTRCEETGRVRLTDTHAEHAKETLAKMAAQLAGRMPEERVRIELAGYVAFDDHVWRYHDFIDRADRAFAELAP